MVVDLLEDLLADVDEVLLELHALGDNVASLGLLSSLDCLANLLIVILALLLGLDKIATRSHSIHKVRLQQVVEGIKVEALVQQLEVDLLGEAHEAYRLVLNLGHQRLIAVVLGCDQLRDKVLTVGLSDSLRLRIEHISQVIMILLLGSSDLNKRQHVQTR